MWRRGGITEKERAAAHDASEAAEPVRRHCSKIEGLKRATAPEQRQSKTNEIPGASECCRPLNRTRRHRCLRLPMLESPRMPEAPASADHWSKTQGKHEGNTSVTAIKPLDSFQHVVTCRSCASAGAHTSQNLIFLSLPPVTTTDESEGGGAGWAAIAFGTRS